MANRGRPKNIDINQENRRINSEKKLKEYIRTMLGEPLITVELTDSQLEYIIDNAIRKWSEFSFGGTEKVGIIFEVNPKIQDYKLDNRVLAITGCSLGGLGTFASTGSGASVYPFGTIGVNYIPWISAEGQLSSLEGMPGDANDAVSGTAGGVGGAGSNTYANAINAWVTRANVDTFRNLFERPINYEFNTNTKIFKLFEEVTGNVMVEAELEYVPNRENDEVYSNPWVKEYATALAKYTWGQTIGKYDQSLVGGANINYDRIISEAQTELEKLDDELINRYSPALGIFSG